jgi:glycosyltransferase involved in cell wall biosynthesis
VPANHVLADFAEAARDRVRVLPAVSEEESAIEFAKGDIFVLPSLFEGTPLTLMEAMGSGLPIVTTETCGMKDVIQHGINGLLIPTRSPRTLAETVGRLIDTPELRETLGRNAAADAARLYRWELVAQPMIAAYDKLGATR